MSTPLSDADRELAWAYALGALDDAERDDAQARVATSAAFAAEVEAAQVDLELIALTATPVDPSEAARAAIRRRQARYRRLPRRPPVPGSAAHHDEPRRPRS